MIEFRLKELLDDVQFVQRFIAANRNAKEAARFEPVTEYFTTVLRDWVHTRRNVFVDCGEKDTPAFKREILRLENEDLRHAHVAVPVQEMGQVSLDVLSALYRLGVVCRTQTWWQRVTWVWRRRG